MWDELADDVKAELSDEQYSGRSHYSRATYAKGCRGPLCRLAEKERGRRRNAARAEAAERRYRPNEIVRDDSRTDELMDVVGRLSELTRERVA